MVRNLPAMWETQVWSLGWEDPLEMATHSSILAWRIPWTWGPSGLQSVGLQRGRYNWATNPEGKGTVPLPEAKRNYYLLQVTHTICLMPLHLYDNHIIIYIYIFVVVVQSPSHIWLFATPWTTRDPCPSPSSGVCPRSCLLNQWCHPTISSSVALFSFCLQSFPASESFSISRLFTSGGQSFSD